MDNNDIILDGSTATWVLPPTDAQTGGTYTGRFVFRCFLTPTQSLQAGRDYRELLGQYGTMITEAEGSLAFALAQLRQRVLKAPPFWTSPLQDAGYAGNIGDTGIISIVLDFAIRSENLFKEKIKAERDVALEQSIKVAEDLLQKEQRVD